MEPDLQDCDEQGSRYSNRNTHEVMDLSFLNTGIEYHSLTKAELWEKYLKYKQENGQRDREQAGKN